MADGEELVEGGEEAADETAAEEDETAAGKAPADDDAKPPTKKAKKTPVKTKAGGGATATGGKKTAASKKTSTATATKTVKPKQPKKKKEEILVSAADISDTESESDDKPLAEMKKPQFPSDEELVEKVKAILDGADLDKITMKIVCRNIYDQYPDQDLSAKKDFIKATVKKIIS